MPCRAGRSRAAAVPESAPRAAHAARRTARRSSGANVSARPIGIHDNFFDLGGDSLAMIRLSLEIEQATGRNFPLTSIFDAPTVAGMAGGCGARSRLPTPLVLLRPGDGEPPVFMVHPVDGTIVQLIPIANAFPGRNPIYGIQAKGLRRTDDRHQCRGDGGLLCRRASPRYNPVDLIFSSACASAALSRWKLPAVCRHVENRSASWLSSTPIRILATGRCASRSAIGSSVGSGKPRRS